VRSRRRRLAEEEAARERHARLVAELEGSPPAGAFAGMTVPQIQEWLGRHQRALHTCTLTTEDLPQP
jgi:hypothetical protein